MKVTESTLIKVYSIAMYLKTFKNNYQTVNTLCLTQGLDKNTVRRYTTMLVNQGLAEVKIDEGNGHRKQVFKATPKLIQLATTTNLKQSLSEILTAI